MQPPEVIGFGALNLDQVYQVERILTDGEAPALSYSAYPGGSAANTIYGLARLGVSCGFVGAVGADEAGRKLLLSFQQAGVDTSHIVRKRGAASGAVLALADERGNRSLYVLPGANSLLCKDDLDLSYIGASRLVHLSSFVDREQMRLQEQALASLPPTTRVSFAPGSLYAARGLAAMRPFLRRTRMLFLNLPELEAMTARRLPEAVQVCLDQGCSTVVVTLGAGFTGETLVSIAGGHHGLVGKGETYTAYIATCGEAILLPLPQDSKPRVKDALGAGDAFTAGFLFGYLRGKGLEQCGRLGQAVALASLTRSGARAALPTLERLRRDYRRLYGEDM